MDIHATHNTDNNLIPFLKWAGGKRWLTNTNISFIPYNYKRYIEPFAGSGAIFFSMPTVNSVLSDINKELITTYIAIKNDWHKVNTALKHHAKNHNYHYYYKIRSSKPKKEHTIAARFIYLNRTCWNGLYRVNLKGEFNVPIGSKNSVILDTDDFEKTSERLSCCEVLWQDFEKTLAIAKDGDFVFIDPPYTVNHNLNGFLKYNEKIFSWDDQKRLRDAVHSAVERGAMITMTNANHKSIHRLYSGLCKIEIIKRNSTIASKSIYRGRTSEVLMRLGWNT